MPEPNETTVNPSLKQEVCTMRIMFPVTSDDNAIGYKKQIAAILAEVPDATIQFAIISGPKSDMLNANRIR